MNLTEEIDRFLSGKLPPHEKHAFQLMIDSDPELAEEVRYQELANEAIVDAQLIELNKKIRTDLDKLNNGGLLNKWVIGGTMLILIGTGAALLNSNPAEKDNTKIISQNPTISTSATPNMQEVDIKETQKINGLFFYSLF